MDGDQYGLVQLFVPMDEDLATVRVYTTADGLQDNFFISQSSCSREGELFFGGIRVITVSSCISGERQ